MESLLRMPEDFKEYNKHSLYSNMNGRIDFDIVNALKNEKLFSRYAAWDFNGLIWWDEKIGYWCCEVFKYREYVITHIDESIEQLINEIQFHHGSK